MEKSLLYPLKSVSRLTGLPAYLVRAWELRYQAVSPQRSDSNRRLYNARDIERLHLLRTAVKNGHRISHVANLTQAELGQLIAPESSESRSHLVEVKTVASSAGNYLTRLMHQIDDLDVNSLQVTLDEAAVNLTRMALILEVIVPLWNKIHELVKTGKSKRINLNVTTMSLQTVLWNMLRTAVVSETAPKVVIAAPSGQHNEIEALALALIAAECGWRSIYFGPNLSATDVAAAVKSSRARAVGLSIHDLNENNSVGTEIRNLRKILNSTVDVIICDNGDLPLDHLAGAEGIFVTKIKNFRQKLEDLITPNRNRLSPYTIQLNSKVAENSNLYH